MQDIPYKILGVAEIYMTKEVWMAMDAIAGCLFGYTAWIAYKRQTAPANHHAPKEQG